MVVGFSLLYLTEDAPNGATIDTVIRICKHYMQLSAYWQATRP